MPDAFVPSVEVRRVSAAEPSHRVTEPNWRRGNEEMHVVAHQAVGEHLPLSATAERREHRHEDLTVGNIVEDELAVVPPCGHVVEAAWRMPPRASWHVPMRSPTLASRPLLPVRR